jgi:hypothetical protein
LDSRFLESVYEKHSARLTESIDYQRDSLLLRIEHGSLVSLLDSLDARSSRYTLSLTRRGSKGLIGLDRRQYAGQELFYRERREEKNVLLLQSMDRSYFQGEGAGGLCTKILERAERFPDQHPPSRCASTTHHVGLRLEAQQPVSRAYIPPECRPEYGSGLALSASVTLRRPATPSAPPMPRSQQQQPQRRPLTLAVLPPRSSDTRLRSPLRTSRRRSARRSCTAHTSPSSSRRP